jgi:predicted  nucleic acid-binding Zn-ribbon protein
MPNNNGSNDHESGIVTLGELYRAIKQLQRNQDEHRGETARQIQECRTELKREISNVRVELADGHNRLRNDVIGHGLGIREGEVRIEVIEQLLKEGRTDLIARWGAGIGTLIAAALGLSK